MNHPELNTLALTLLIKSTLFLAAVWIAFLVIRKRSATAQSHYWRTALVGLLILAVAAFCLPWLEIKLPAVETITPSNTEPVYTEWRTTGEELAPVAIADAVDVPAANAEAQQQGFSNWLFLVWGAGALACLFRSLIGVVRLHRLRRRATSLLNDPHWRGLLSSAQEACGTDRRVGLFGSEMIRVPLVCGLFRPAIFLPANIDWDDERSRMVLIHELAHVKRSDAFFLALGQLCLALYWMNPLMWLVIRRLHASNESAADDAVLAAGCQPSAYAGVLLDVAKHTTGRPPLLSAAMAQQPSAVGKRVETILDQRQRRDLPRRSSRMLTLSVIGAVAAATGGAMLVSAQENSENPEKKSPTPNISDGAVTIDSSISIVSEKLKRIILPSLDFEEATIEEGLDFLRRKTMELDTLEPDPSKKGVNIVLRASKDKPPAGPITLKLTNVPVSEALRYITELTNYRYKIEPFGVVIVPKADANSTVLFTRTFRVPPTFTSGSDELFPEDGGSDLPRRATAKETLERIGITFPEGASAAFDPSTSSLIVRNTEANMELVEAHLQKNLGSKPQVLNVNIEIYAMPKKDAFTLLSRHGSNSDAVMMRDTLTKGLKEDAFRLIASPHIVSRSGQKAKIESGQAIDYVSAYTVKDGRDEPVHRSAFAGIQVEIEPVLGADGHTIDANLMITEGVGEPRIETRKSVAPVSGKEVEVSQVRLEQMTLNTSTVLYSGQPRLVGVMNSPNLEKDEAHVVILSITKLAVSGK